MKEGEGRAGETLLALALSTVDLLRPLARPLGIEFDPFRAILEVKLRLDLRRPFGVQGNWAGLLPVLAMNAIFGSLIALLASQFGQPRAYVVLVEAAAMFFLCLVLLVDFTSVLLDTADVSFLASRPVGDRTLLAARLVHVALYLGLVAGSFSIGPVLIGLIAFKDLPLLAALILSSALGAALAALGTLLLLLLAMRLLPAHRLKGGIHLLQLLFLVVATGAGQILPAVVDVSSFEAALAGRTGAAWFLPPAWFGALLDVLSGNRDRANLILASLALVVPALALLLALRFGSSRFLASLLAMQVERGAPRRRLGLVDGAAALLCRGGVERAGFGLFAALSMRERAFRMRTWPGFGMAIFVGLGFLLRQRGGTAGGTWVLLTMLYLVAATLPTVVIQSRFGENWEARWILEASPIDRPGEFVAGGAKACAAFFVLPLLLLCSILTLAAGGPALLPDILFASGAILASSFASFRVLGRTIPFSQRYSPGIGGEPMMALVLGFLVVAAGAALHVGARTGPGLLYPAAAALWIGAGLSARSLRGMTVRGLESLEREAVLAAASSLLPGRARATAPGAPDPRG